MHLEGATMFEGMWPHALSNIEAGHGIIMELKYKNLHDKIKILEGRSKPKRGTSEQHDTPTTGQPRIINLTKKLTKEQINILNLGPQYAMEISPKKCINNIIIETESAIRNLEPKWQNIYTFQASKLIKMITEKHKQNPLHKHQKKVIDKLKKEVNTEDIIVMKADKNKTMVLIDRKQCMDKVHEFLKDNDISTIKLLNSIKKSRKQ